MLISAVKVIKAGDFSTKITKLTSYKSTTTFLTMEEEKQTCTRCRTSKEISHFQIASGKLRKTCAKCRKGKKRRSNSDFEELERSVLKQKIKNFLENNVQEIQLECLIKAEEFEGNEQEIIAKNVAKFIQDCDGYVYKYVTFLYCFDCCT